MTRSPLFYALGRGIDVDAGGAVELQTDVMRFMAILSLCLVAIFALVQSLPVVEKPADPVAAVTEAPLPVRPEPDVTAKPVTVSGLQPVTSVEKPQIRDTRIETPATVAEPESRQLVTVPEAAAQAPVPGTLPVAQVPAAAQTPVQRIGFTLQFESDEVLERLVSRKDVGLYVIAADKSMRLSIDGQRMNFWPASLPAQYHEMDSSTVPVDVRRALLRSGTDTSVDATWGVTLPPRTAIELQQFLADASGGSLVIGSDGDLRLEP